MPHFYVPNDIHCLRSGDQLLARKGQIVEGTIEGDLFYAANDEWVTDASDLKPLPLDDMDPAIVEPTLQYQTGLPGVITCVNPLRVRVGEMDRRVDVAYDTEYKEGDEVSVSFGGSLTTPDGRYTEIDLLPEDRNPPLPGEWTPDWPVCNGGFASPDWSAFATPMRQRGVLYWAIFPEPSEHSKHEWDPVDRQAILTEAEFRQWIENGEQYVNLGTLACRPRIKDTGMKTTVLNHSDGISGTTILANGTRIYWTEGRSSSVTVRYVDGRLEHFVPAFCTPEQQTIYNAEQVVEERADEYRGMTAAEEEEWESVRADPQDPARRRK